MFKREEKEEHIEEEIEKEEIEVIEQNEEIRKDKEEIKEVEKVIENEDKNTDLERFDNITETTIIENIASTEDEYITYHIHIVKENETIDKICNEYNITANLLSEYNEIKEIKIGDKLIIPQDLDE